MRVLTKDEAKQSVSALTAANTVVAVTHGGGYEEQRLILREAGYDATMEKVFHILNGSHCSCYGFDETEWDATEYTLEELENLMRMWQEKGLTEERLFSLCVRESQYGS